MLTEMLYCLVHYRDSEGVGSQTEGFTCSQHGAHGRRNQEGLLDGSLWYVTICFQP